MYKGRQYRSRLEARWASFFDLVGWRFEYEPYDLPGWIPDFAIYNHEDQEMLVEVKPYSTIEEFSKTESQIHNALREGDKEECEILLLGVSIKEEGYSIGFPSLGWLMYYTPEDVEFTSMPCSEAVFNCYNGEWGFYSGEGSWDDRITGKYDGNRYVHPPTSNEVLKLWNEAANITQWKSPRKRRRRY